MQIFRFLLIPFLTYVLSLVQVQKTAFKFLNPQNHCPYQKTKWLWVPLLIQTIIEYPTHTYLAYLPTRLCMIILTLLSMFLTSSFLQCVLRTNHKTIDILSYITALTLGFLFESYYITALLPFHPYDPIFAFLGFIFLLLIYILNDFYLEDTSS